MSPVRGGLAPTLPLFSSRLPLVASSSRLPETVDPFPGRLPVSVIPYTATMMPTFHPSGILPLLPDSETLARRMDTLAGRGLSQAMGASRSSVPVFCRIPALTTQLPMMPSACHLRFISARLSNLVPGGSR